MKNDDIKHCTFKPTTYKNWPPEFLELIKDVVVADDPKPSIPYVDKEKFAEKEQENRERIKEIKNLSEELNKLLKELAFITGKHIAATEMKKMFQKIQIYMRNL